MQVTTELVLGVGAAVVGICAWLFRLEGRVNTHDVEHAQHRQDHEDVKTDVRYIRDRIDEVIGRKGY